MSAEPTNPRSDWIALYVLCVGMLMIVLDGTIVNVALPSLKSDLEFSDTGLAWVLNAYLIAFGGLLLLGGRIGDLLGQRKMFLLGMAIFTVASVLCGLAQSQGMLIGARFLQGVGGALGSSVILAMIVTIFRQPQAQAKALGVYGFVASAGGSLGLLLGGILTDAISWHWIFFVNVPIGLATLVLTWRLVPDRPGIGLHHGADIRGASLLTGGLMLGVYAILGVEQYGWGATRTLVLAVVAIVLLAAFLRRQTRVAEPLMPLRLFRSRNVSGANVIQALLIAGMFGLFFFGARYLGEVLGYTPIEVGLAFLPGTVLIGLMSLRVAEPLMMRFGPRAVLIPGLLSLMLALLWFSRTPVDGDYVVDVLPSMILFGIGAGISFPPIMTMAMSGATPQDSGLASGLVNTAMQMGGAIGLAVLATFAADHKASELAAGVGEIEALNAGFHLAYLIGAGLLALAVLVAIVVMRSPAPPQASDGEAQDPSDPRNDAAPATPELAGAKAD
jgi:EmrB/QacA subfamily drug resistance transporter